MGQPERRRPIPFPSESRLRGVDRMEPADLEFIPASHSSPPAIAPDRSPFDPSANQHPILRRLSALQISLLLIIGMGIGGYIYVSQQGSRVSTEPETVSISVLSALESLAPSESEGADPLAASAAQKLKLDQRRFLYTKGSLRGSEPGYRQPSAPPGQAKGAASKPTEADFRPIPSEPGRYTTQDSPREWQGGWRYDDPEHNLKLGQSYDRYITNSFGSPKLSVAGDRPIDILPRLEGLAAEPAPR